MKTEITKLEIIAALKKLGVKTGDLLLVHASTSKCGHIDGGAETIIAGILAAVGARGTVLVPTFTYPFEMFDGEAVVSKLYKPFDATDIASIWTGNIPQTFLRRYPEALRSHHITHSWAALGPLAKKCTETHELSAPPASSASPMGKALEFGGKILYFGTGLAPTTFLHFIEDHAEVPFLAPAVCRVKNPDGTFQTVTIAKHLPGHRDFYRNDADNCKFFTRAIAAGLKITTLEFGIGTLQLIDIRNLFEIGVKLIKEDYRILLCDDSACAFCRKF